MLPRIDKAIANEDLINNKDLLRMLSDTKLNEGEIHVAGLISDGGVHGHARHLKSLTHIASKKVQRSTCTYSQMVEMLKLN